MIKIFIFLTIFISISFASSLKEVYFKNNKTLKSEYLYKNLGIYIEKAWYEFYKNSTPKANDILIKSLKISIINLYKNQGFYHTFIDTIEDDKSITFVIDENTPLSIKDIKIDSDYEISKIIDFKKGDRFISQKFVDIKKKIKNIMKQEGFCNYDLISKAYVDLKLNTVNLTYDLSKNKICKFGDIKVVKPDDIVDKVILSRLYYKKDSPYSSKYLVKSYESLLGLDAFDSANIKEENYGSQINTTVIVTPKKNRIRRKIGVGYETLYGPRAIFGWEERNFYGGARKLAFELKYSKDEQYFKNTFFFPAFLKLSAFKTYLDLKNEFVFSRIAYKKFEEEKYVDIIHLQKDYETFSIDLGLDYENIKIKTDGGVCGVENGTFILLSPFIKAIYDNRDSKIDPKKGLYLSAFLETGLTYLASSSSYSKLLLEGRLIKTIGEFTIAGKSKLGMINVFEKTLPESKLFFAGGGFSNRAYAYNRLSATDGSCDSLGGKTMIDNSLEISHPISENFSLGVFWDATMLSRESNYFDLDFKHSYGGGIRYITPIGPIKFDIGFDSKDSSIYALHLQVGQSY